jgi:probable HAF family extracellular repeat protein
MKIARYSLLLLLTLLLAAAPAFGAARYKATEIVLPPGATLDDLDAFGKLVGINNQGVVAGFYKTSRWEAYRWQNGVMTGLPLLLGEETILTEAYAINNQGQIAGVTVNSTGTVAPCIWEGDSPFTPAALPDGGTKARGLNDLGQVVGNRDNYDAVLWKDGVRTDLPILGSSGQSDGLGINKNGVMVGYSQESWLQSYRWPVLWREDGDGISITNLGDFGEKPGFPDRGGVAYAINDLNQVVGYAFAPLGDFGTWRAFLWEDNVLTDLGALQENGTAYALAINNAGQIVGYSYLNEPPGARAVLWEKGKSIIDLNTRIDPIPGWYLREAQAINDRGQIVCLAEDNVSNKRIYLLTPVSSLVPIFLLLND